MVVVLKAQHWSFQCDQFVEPAIINRLPIPEIKVNGQM
jgi:hypothetical protein